MSRPPGTLVRARGRDWVVLPDGDDTFIVARPLDGDPEFTTGLFADEVSDATFGWPSAEPDEIGDDAAAGLLRTALRVGFTSSAGPFRGLADIAVEPRQYQFVPLLLALRLDPVRLLIGDDVGVGKTIEAGLIAKELMAQGSANGVSVLCPPALAEQWQAELREKFGIDAELVLPSTARRLERDRIGGGSIFQRHPCTVVSTEFIKDDYRRDIFSRTAPNLVIVDEAHTCVPASDGSRARQNRYELLKKVADDKNRHLVLVTATPHSGKDTAFQNLIGLLDPALTELDLDASGDRDRLARHFVQRRRRDIRSYLDQDTKFPADRQTRDVAFRLSDSYAALMRKVLLYARETVRDTGGDVHQRIRWWSALALLRSVASSPRAAAATLRARSVAAAAQTVKEADDLGSTSVMDLTIDEAEDVDAPPGAQDDEMPPRARERLLALAREADRVEDQVRAGGLAADGKLATLVTEVKRLVADGWDPIVFCRFIPTADYVAEHLGKALGRKAAVRSVTGELPPAERQERVAELAAETGRHVLVATDCLSEGVNLQEHFQAVIHYDLAWNPTRHEQREGRVDRFGQRRTHVRAVTMYGTDNGIDGIVLDVLIRKHRAIAASTGVSVPVPASGDNVVRALAEGLLMRGDAAVGQGQLDLAFDTEEETAALESQWLSAAERERRTITKFAHSALRADVEREMNEVRAVLGARADIVTFTRDALSALGAQIVPDPEGFTARTTGMAPEDVQALDLPSGDSGKAVFRYDLPVASGQHALVRTDPLVTRLARHIREAALDPQIPARRRPARRCGVLRTSAVDARTTLLLVRYRFNVSLPGRTGQARLLVAEDARMRAYRGGPDAPDWLTDDEVAELLAARPEDNVLPEKVVQAARRAVGELPGLAPALDEYGGKLADEFRAAHARVRDLLGRRTKSLDVTAITGADVLGVYVYLPAGTR